MSYLDIAKQIDEGTGCKTAIMPDPCKVAKDYFEKQEIIKTAPLVDSAEIPSFYVSPGHGSD